MTTYKTKTELKLKSQEIIPAGSLVEMKDVINDGKLVVLFVPLLNREIKINTKAFAAKILGKKIPSINTLTKWDNDGICMTPTGHRVEPDGTGPDGIPCWNLIMGII
jgi:hypothetical protein